MIGDVPMDAVSRATSAGCLATSASRRSSFPARVADNIAYGTDNASADDIRRVAEMANLHEDICQMPGGYDATISERGQNLSGGQRQRLALGSRAV